jgi:hypothetical protein
LQDYTITSFSAKGHPETYELKSDDGQEITVDGQTVLLDLKSGCCPMTSGSGSADLSTSRSPSEAFADLSVRQEMDRQNKELVGLRVDLDKWRKASDAREQKEREHQEDLRLLQLSLDEVRRDLKQERENCRSLATSATTVTTTTAMMDTTLTTTRILTKRTTATCSCPTSKPCPTPPLRSSTSSAKTPSRTTSTPTTLSSSTTTSSLPTTPCPDVSHSTTSSSETGHQEAVSDYSLLGSAEGVAGVSSVTVLVLVVTSVSSGVLLFKAKRKITLLIKDTERLKNEIRRMEEIVARAGEKEAFSKDILKGITKIQTLITTINNVNTNITRTRSETTINNIFNPPPASTDVPTVVVLSPSVATTPPKSPESFTIDEEEEEMKKSSAGSGRFCIIL